MNMKKSLLTAASLAAVLPLAAQASVVVQQANQRIAEPLAPVTSSVTQDKVGVDAANVLGHSAAMTESTLALMAHSKQSADLPATEHNLDTPEQPSDW